MYWVILFWSIVLISNVRTLLLFFTDHKFLFLDNVCNVDDDNDDDDDDVDNDDSIEPLTDKNRKFKPVPRLDGLPSAQPIAVFDTTVYWNQVWRQNSKNRKSLQGILVRMSFKEFHEFVE